MEGREKKGFRSFRLPNPKHSERGGKRERKRKMGSLQIFHRRFRLRGQGRFSSRENKHETLVHSTLVSRLSPDRRGKTVPGQGGEKEPCGKVFAQYAGLWERGERKKEETPSGIASHREVAKEERKDEGKRSQGEGNHRKKAKAVEPQ